jgi:hypothetical protein
MPAAPAGSSKHGLRANRQAAEEAPRQPRVIGENDALRLGNHAGYIANRTGFDNETLPAYSALAEAASSPTGPCASAMRAFLPRRPRR